MKARLYCKHCEKHYDVELQDIRLVQKSYREQVTFAHNTYYFEEGCFFKTVNELKGIDNDEGASA